MNSGEILTYTLNNIKEGPLLESNNDLTEAGVKALNDNAIFHKAYHFKDNIKHKEYLCIQDSPNSEFKIFKKSRQKGILTRNKVKRKSKNGLFKKISWFKKAKLLLSPFLHLYLYGSDVYFGNTNWRGLQNGKVVYIWRDGKIYNGEWKGGEKEGKGVMKYTDGAIYDGEWKNGNPEGNGILKDDNGTYNGEWKGGEKEGRGILKYTDGAIYDGEWKGSNKEGKGVDTSSLGYKYDGLCKNGMSYSKYHDNKYEKTPKKDIPTIVLYQENHEKSKFENKYKNNLRSLIQLNKGSFANGVPGNVIEAINNLPPGTQTLRFVISAHGGLDGTNDLGVTLEHINKIMILVKQQGVTGVIWIDNSCLGTMGNQYKDIKNEGLNVKYVFASSDKVVNIGLNENIFTYNKTGKAWNRKVVYRGSKEYIQSQMEEAQQKYSVAGCSLNIPSLDNAQCDANGQFTVMRDEVILYENGQAPEKYEVNYKAVSPVSLQ
jgi:hypothetical protein